MKKLHEYEKYINESKVVDHAVEKVINHIGTEMDGLSAPEAKLNFMTALEKRLKEINKHIGHNGRMEHH